LKPNAETLVRAMVQHEEAIASLYQTFADQYPTHRPFWTDLAAEEQMHARWLQRLLKATENGRFQFTPGKLQPTAIALSIRSIQARQQQAESGQLNLIGALSFARDLEKSLIESHFLDPFQGVTEETESILHKLTAATEQHINKVTEVWKKTQE